MKLSRQQARRIGRAQRAAHAFHWFAHHPLCEEYQTEIVRFGIHTRLCKGCVMFAAGVVLGIVAGIALRISDIGSRTSEIGARISDIGLSVLILAALSLSLFAYSLFTRRRLPKTLTRLIPGFLGTFSITLVPYLFICFPVAIVLYRRRGPNRSPCLTCPERDRAIPCRGYKPIADAERAFIRLSHRIIDARAN